MTVSIRLAVYIARKFLNAALAAFVVLLIITFLIDLGSLNGRGGHNSELTFLTVIEMALLHLPELSQKLLPFAVLIATIVTYVRFTRTSELVVMRATGMSVWQFLFPSMAMALALGLFSTLIINPLSATTSLRYEQMEALFLRSQGEQFAVEPGNFWLREGDETRQSVIHANEVSINSGILRDAIVLVFENGDRLTERYDARHMQLTEGAWVLDDVIITRPDLTIDRVDSLSIPTSFDTARIQDRFATPVTLSFWELPGFIADMKTVGSNTTSYRLHLHGILVAPLVLVAMVLVAAGFSLRLTRLGGIWLFMMTGTGAGLFYYFVSDIFLAFGMSGTLPVMLAAWAPSLIVAALGGALLFHLEDG